MLHSSMSSKEQWSKLAATLKYDYHTIAIDLYGYGGGEYPKNPASFTLADEALRIDTIIAGLIGKEPYHLIGHSYGGATALRLAYSNQEQIISLALFEPVLFHLLEKTDPARASVLEVIDRIKSYVDNYDFSEATRVFVDFWSGNGTYDGISQTKQSLLNGGIKKVLLDFQAGIYEPLTIEDYRTIKLPVCLITSPQSPLPTRQIIHHLENALPHRQMHRVDGGHMAPISNAKNVNPILEAFIRTI